MIMKSLDGTGSQNFKGKTKFSTEKMNHMISEHIFLINSPLITIRIYLQSWEVMNTEGALQLFHKKKNQRKPLSH